MGLFLREDFGGYGDEFEILMESTGLKYLRSDAGGFPSRITVNQGRPLLKGFGKTLIKRDRLPDYFLRFSAV